MLESLHELLYSLRWLVLLVALVGIAYALILYTRAFQAISVAPTAGNSARRQRLRARRGGAAGKPLAAQEAPTEPIAEDDYEDDDGSFADDDQAVDAAQASTQEFNYAEHEARQQQQNLLADFPDDGYGNDGDHAEASAEQAEAEDPPTTAIGGGYGVDQHARTRHDLGPYPPETRRYGVNDEATTSLSRRREHQSSHTSPQRAPTEPLPGNDKEAPSDEELLRRATRMEELGFHVGIVPEQLRQDPGRVSDNEKQELLRTLGIMEEHAQTAVSGPQSPATPEADHHDKVNLDDILAKLDQALSDEFEPGEQPQPPHPPSTDPAAAAEQPAAPAQDDTPTIDSPPPKPEAAAAPQPRADETDNDEPVTAPPPRNVDKPAGTPRAVPDWARADTFDEDVDGPKGNQLDIFNNDDEDEQRDR